MNSKLAVFDFNYTIIDRSQEAKLSVDFYGLANLFSNDDSAQDIFQKLKNPKIHVSEKWKVFNQNTTVTKFDVNKVLKSDGVLVNGMDQVLQTLNKDHDIIVISNNHKFVIEPILDDLNLLQFIKEVFAKPSRITNDGKIKDFDKVPENWIGCQECDMEQTHGFCKTLVLKEYVSDKLYDEIIYFGDGINDLCPTLSLGSRDKIFPRRDFPLEDALKVMASKAQVLPWSDGFEVLKYVLK